MKYLILILSVFSLGFGYFNITYDKPVTQDLINRYGEPIILDKTSYNYKVSATRNYATTKTGVLDFFNSQAAKDFYTSDQRPYTEAVEVLQHELGYGNVPFGNITHESSEPTTDPRLTFHELKFSNGPVIQYYVGVPESSIGQMIYLHGCSGYPDSTIDRNLDDYNNSAALVALEHGWTVYSIYLFSECDYLDNLTSLGQVYSGIDIMGYDVMVVDKVIEHHNLEDVTIYGISMGAQIAVYSTVLIPKITDIIISGNMIFNYADVIAEYNTKGNNSYKRIGLLSNLRRQLSMESMVKFISLKTHSPIMIEIGSFDERAPEAMQSFTTWCNSQAECEYDIVFFRGYHETAPEHTLPKLLHHKNCGVVSPEETQ